MATIIPSSSTTISQLMTKRADLQAWLDSNEDEDSDIRTDIVDAYHAVELRIAEEPARSLLDLQAKAAILRGNREGDLEVCEDREPDLDDKLIFSIADGLQALSDDREIMALYAAYEQAWDDWDAASKRLADAEDAKVDETTIATLVTAEGDAEQRWIRTEERIIATPANTVRGIICKLKALDRYEHYSKPEGHPQYQGVKGDLFMSALRDAERLAGEAV